MSESDSAIKALQRRVEALEEEAARLRQSTESHSSLPVAGSRRQMLLGGAGMLGALAGGALLGRPNLVSAADEQSGVTSGSARYLGLAATITPLKTRGVLWASYEWELGAHFTGKQPPVVVAMALDDYMEQDVAACCICAVAVRGEPGRYRATIMVRNISALATSVTINALAVSPE